MLPIVFRIWKLLRSRQLQTSRRQQRLCRSRRRRLEFEPLEQRLTPATSGFTGSIPAVVAGIVYIDSDNNGVRDPGELALPGVSVTLTGTTDQGTAVSSSTTTDANGQYVFFQVQPGSYNLTRGAASNFLDGQPVYGDLGGTLGNDAIAAISVAQGQAAVNYNFAVRGLAPSLVSLRDFLSTSNNSAFLPAPGAGSVAVDNSVQPSTPAATGTASLAGAVLTASGTGLQGVQIGLTGTDNTGRDILRTTTTGADGAYQLTGLVGGTYNLNVSAQPAGFRSGQPTAGSLGGQIFQNGQILDIQVATGVSGTKYTFTEVPVPAPAAGSSVAITAALADDTAGPGGTSSDGITSDPSVQGSIASSIVAFRAGLDSTPVASFVSVAGSLTAGGTFFLNRALMAQIAGGTLADGTHTLRLQATNAQGQTGNFDLTFTLENTAPVQPTLHLDSQSDPTQSGTTTSSTVTLQGQTSAGVQVQLIQKGAVVDTTTASATGAFSFANIHLTAGANDYTVQATDKAGNTSQLQTFFVEETEPFAVPTQPVNETVPTGSSDKFIDLSSPTLFTDAAFSNSLVRLNTSAGPINLELFDTQAPQTVANFLDYIQQGDYNNDIFHRLVQNFVLQGGGFTFNPSSPGLTAVTEGPHVPNEFDNTNRPNVLGTIAMAKMSDPNSATSQFFFNLTDNTQTLGASNSGGFTVFGKVVSGADQRVLNTLAAAPIVDETSFNGALNTLPLKNYSGTKFPTDTTSANYDLITSVTVVRQTEQLTYSVASNSDTAGNVVTASIDNFGQLDLHPVAQGTATIAVKATDKAGKTAQVTFAVTVAPPVVVTNPGNQTNLDGDVVSVPISATDNTGGTLTYQASGLPSGLTINSSSGLISGTLATTAHTHSPYTVVVTAADGTNSGNQTFTWTVNPVVTISTVPNQANKVGDTVSLQVSAQDARHQPLTYSASNLPSGLKIDASSGLISGTIASASGSPFAVIVTANDGTNSADQAFSWAVSS